MKNTNHEASQYVIFSILLLLHLSPHFFTNALNLCPSFGVSDRVLHPYKKHVKLYWTNCTFGLYPSSGVSKNWGIKNRDKISQCTRPQNSHKGQLLTTEPLTWVHTHINPWS
jgi:hypothetical protein